MVCNTNEVLEREEYYIDMLLKQGVDGIIAAASVAKEKEFTLEQSFVLPVSVVQIFVPEGMEVEGEGILKDRLQDIQGTSYQVYSTGNLSADDVLSLTFSGTPKAASSSTGTSNPWSAADFQVGCFQVDVVYSKPSKYGNYRQKDGHMFWP